MAIGLTLPNDLAAVSGIRIGTCYAGVRKQSNPDLMLMELAAGSECAAVFTRNAFCAAPVTVAREHLSQSSPRFLMVNAGNANAGTGDLGMADASNLCAALAELAKIEKDQVLPFSTGVIGEPLPTQNMLAAIPDAIKNLSEDNWLAGAQAIMTTDTIPKAASRQLEVAGESVTLTGIAKGSGMIRPDMATMLSFIATDANISGSMLQRCLDVAVNQSFNRITVDGDTSTNDACVLVSSGQAAHARIEDESGEGFTQFQSAVTSVCRELAQAIVRDGEGVTRLITVEVTGAQTTDEALDVAYTVAHSPLVKTAVFGQDPNWGRILAAVGRAGVSELDISRIQIFLDDVCIVRNGGRSEEYTEEQGQAVMANEEITIRIELARGETNETVWTTDLSYDYIKINADYRT